MISLFNAFSTLPSILILQMLSKKRRGAKKMRRRSPEAQKTQERPGGPDKAQKAQKPNRNTETSMEEGRRSQKGSDFRKGSEKARKRLQ